VAAALAGRTRGDALAALSAAGVSAAPCLGFADLLVDPHLAANGLFVTMPDRHSVRSRSGPLVDLRRRPSRYRRLAPGHGAHSREVLGELGYDEARVAALLAAGVVRA